MTADALNAPAWLNDTIPVAPRVVKAPVEAVVLPIGVELIASAVNNSVVLTVVPLSVILEFARPCAPPEPLGTTLLVIAEALVLQVGQAIAPAAEIVIGDEPLKPDEPTAEIGSCPDTSAARFTAPNVGAPAALP